MATVSNGTLSVTAEIMAAQIERNLRREAVDQVSAAAPLIQSGTPGLLSGQVTYLADTLTAALALDAIYTALATVVLSGANATEARRNFAVVPCPVSTTSWYSNNGTLYPATYDAAGGRRSGTGARKFVRAASSPTSTLASAYAAGSADWTVAGRIPVNPGEVWTASVYSKASVDFSSVIAIGFFDAAGVQVGAFNTSDSVTGTAGTWVRSGITVTVPAGSTNMGIVRQQVDKATGVSTGGEQVWMADALIERGSLVNDYFDGGYSPDPDLLPSWAGTASASQSFLTSTDLPSGLNGLKHVAVGNTRMTAERALPGRRAKWLVTVEIVEVPA